jgi:hypothetical protein
MKNERGTSGTNDLADEGARGFVTAPGVRGTSGSIPGVRGFATSTQNTDAASELYSGPKSDPVPVHDSVGGYDTTPVLADNIQTMAKQRGYQAAS